VVPGQRPGALELGDQLEPGGRAIGHRHRDRPVELDDGRGRQVGEPSVQAGDLGPVGLGGVGGSRVARRDGRLQLVVARAVVVQGAVEQAEPLLDLAGVPASAVPVLERHDVARLVHAGIAAGVLQQHERKQPERLGLVGHEARQDAGEADRLGAQAPAHEVGAGGGGVALGEQQVQHGEHAAGALGQQQSGLSSSVPNFAAGCLDATSIASSRSSHSSGSSPAICSLVSANGPSDTSTSPLRT
jgi:hypothetical protein